jgi:N-acetylglucosaminyldiphosphoundecaprenol N-acetyl-beta-D-mannosaminyltransferase
MSIRKLANILGCQVDLLTVQEVIDRIKEFIEQDHPAHIITLNAEIVYQAQSNQELKEIINSADLVTPDGIGIVWGGRKLGYDISERVTGIDLLLNLCQEAPKQGWKIYLIGSAPTVAEAAANKLSMAYPGLQICGTHHGYFQEDDETSIVKEIKEVAPHIIFVALGAPKQELWIKKHRDQLGVPACIGVGGSLDVIAGHKNRAPDWMIRINLEWLYRLIVEPNRLQRQLVLPKFVGLILKSKQQNKAKN